MSCDSPTALSPAPSLRWRNTRPGSGFGASSIFEARPGASSWLARAPDRCPGQSGRAADIIRQPNLTRKGHHQDQNSAVQRPPCRACAIASSEARERAGEELIMKMFSFVIFVTLPFWPVAASAQLNVLISGGFSGAYEQLLPEFERTSGIKVTTGSGASQGTGPQTI